MFTRILVACTWVAASCLGTAMAQNTPDRGDRSERTTDRQQERRWSANHYDEWMVTMPERDARSAGEALRSNNVSLTKAIEAAESRADGKAISATCYTSGNSPIIQVCCVDKQNQLKVVVVDMNGKVTGVREARFAGWGGSDSSSSMTTSLVKAEDVIGKTVKNAANENLGKIDELVIDVPRGRIAYAVLASGGLLGVNEKHFAIPWSALHTLHNDTLMLDIDKAQLERAPSFDKQHWPDMSNADWGRTIYGYYHQQPYWELDGKTLGASSLLRSSEIISRKVTNNRDEDLGKIEDLAIDSDNGRILYAALSFGGFLGINDKLFAVPWTGLMRTNDGKWVLNVDKERLKTATGFDKQHWPSSANPELDRNPEPRSDRNQPMR